MNKKRDRLQVIYDILRCIKDKNGKIKPTHILYKSNLSHQMMDDYISELIEKGFINEIKKEGNSKTYSITQKGQDYLSKYKVIIDFVNSFGLV
jgi:predicted transcriptional regulator